jgi:hypothetical protein
MTAWINGVRRWVARRSDLERCLLGASGAKLYLLLILYLLFLTTKIREDEYRFVCRSGRQTESARLHEIGASFLDRLAPYDGQWYLDIARHGYRKLSNVERKGGRLPEGNYAFFPLLPTILWIGDAVSRGHGDKVALLLIAAASVLGVVIAWKLAERSGARAPLTALLLVTYPSAAFHAVLYTEGLFLLLVGLTLLFASEKRLVAAAITGILGGLCRPQGVLLVLPIAVELLLPRLRSDRDIARRDTLRGALAALAPLAGFVVMGCVSYAVTDSPRAFMAVQSTWGRSYEATGILDALTSVIGYRGPPMDLLGLLIGVGALPLLWKRLPVSMALFGTAMVAFPLLTGSLLSFSRFISVSVPHFLALSLLLANRPRLTTATIAVFLALQVLLAKGLVGWYFVG